MFMTNETDNGAQSVLPLTKRQRRFVVVVDDSQESSVALRFASARAAHTEGGRLVLFHILEPSEFGHWMAVEDRMREEKYEEAEELLRDIAGKVFDYCGGHPEIVIREGQPKDELLKFLEEEKDLFALFLGASSEGDPGPLVNNFSGPLVGSLHCPVVIVPGCLDDEEIDMMA